MIPSEKWRNWVKQKKTHNFSHKNYSCIILVAVNIILRAMVLITIKKSDNKGNDNDSKSCKK